jgi:hypothetical protein
MVTGINVQLYFMTRELPVENVETLAIFLPLATQLQTYHTTAQNRQ